MNEYIYKTQKKEKNSYRGGREKEIERERDRDRERMR